MKKILCKVSFAALTALVAMVVIDLLDGTLYDMQILYWFSLLSIIFSFAVLATSQSFRLGFHFIIYLYTTLCMLGYVLASNWDSEAAVFRSENTMRFQDGHTYYIAIEISILFLYCFLLPSLFAKNNRGDSTFEIIDNSEVSKAAFKVGNSILIICCFLLAYIYAITQGVDYSMRRIMMEEIPWYGHIITILSYAFTLVIAICDKNQWKKALIPYGFITIIQLLMGNRGEVLYSIVTCYAIYYLRYRQVKLKLLLTGGFALVMVIPMIRNYRTELSLASYSHNILGNIVETLSELGFQIASFTYTIDNIQAGADYRWGGTYLYGLFDFIGRKIPGVGGMPEASLDHIKYIMPQVGLGYSQVAEIYYNFGVLIGAFVMVAFGYFTIYIERLFLSTNTSISLRIFSALFIVELVNLTRNTSETLPLYTIYIIIIIIMVNVFIKRVNQYDN